MKAVEIPLPSHARGTEVALAQRQALIRQLEPLEPHQWQLVTECAPWTVRDIAAHIAGTLSYTRNPLAYAGLVTGWLLHFRGRNFVDGTNEAAIRTYRRLSTDQLLEVLRRDTPRAVPPGWSRPLKLMGVASLPKYATFGHLADVVLPRDRFMHRYDIGRATGVDVPRDPTDADVVAQVVRDLGLAWTGPASVLRLSGTGGGEWQVRAGTPDDAAPRDPRLGRLPSAPLGPGRQPRPVRRHARVGARSAARRPGSDRSSRQRCSLPLTGRADGARRPFAHLKADVLSAPVTGPDGFDSAGPPLGSWWARTYCGATTISRSWGDETPS